MASRQNPGGGVQNGAGAQEENLFRRTNLFQSLYQFAPFASNFGLHKSKHQYPLDRNFGGIYTPHATVFRGTEQDGYPLLDTPYQMSFIAVAGINRPALASPERIAPELVEPVKNKIRTIFPSPPAGRQPHSREAPQAPDAQTPQPLWARPQSMRQTISHAHRESNPAFRESTV